MLLKNQGTLGGRHAIVNKVQHVRLGLRQGDPFLHPTLNKQRQDESTKALCQDLRAICVRRIGGNVCLHCHSPHGLGQGENAKKNESQ